jgi:hypothetical protein
MNKVRRKLFEAKKLIANTPTKKEGKNTYSKYDYFTPSQVSKLVFDACTEVGIVTGFDLENTGGFGYLGTLTIFDIDSDDLMNFSMATDMPEMKAANVTQQLGATATYVQRYLEMATFGIVDNNLDPDTKDNRPNKEATKTLPAAQFQKGANQVTDGSLSIADFEKKLSKFELTDVQSKSLLMLKSTLV